MEITKDVARAQFPNISRDSLGVLSQTALFIATLAYIDIEFEDEIGFSIIHILLGRSDDHREGRRRAR